MKLMHASLRMLGDVKAAETEKAPAWDNPEQGCWRDQRKQPDALGICSWECYS